MPQRCFVVHLGRSRFFELRAIVRGTAWRIAPSARPRPIRLRLTEPRSLVSPCSGGRPTRHRARARQRLLRESAMALASGIVLASGRTCWHLRQLLICLFKVLSPAMVNMRCDLLVIDCPYSRHYRGGQRRKLACWGVFAPGMTTEMPSLIMIHQSAKSAIDDPLGTSGRSASTASIATS